MSVQKLKFIYKIYTTFIYKIYIHDLSSHIDKTVISDQVFFEDSQFLILQNAYQLIQYLFNSGEALVRLS